MKQKYGQKAQITLIEKSHRAGGWIRTEHKGGFLFELGPHSIRSKGGKVTLQLIEELKLQNEVILPAVTKRYLFFNNRLNPIPQNPLHLLFSPVSRGLFSAILKDLFTSSNPESDESIYNFVTRRFGTEIAERLFDPLTTGIYAGNIRELSIRSCFPQLHQWEQKKGSVIRGFLAQKKEKSGPGLFSFRNGMETLITALCKHVGHFVKLNTEIKCLRLKSESIELMDSLGNIHQADHLFCALPSFALAPLLEPFNPALTNSLSSIPHASLIVANVGYKKDVLKKQGFGYLVPTKECEDVLGVIWDSCVFPQQSHFPQETRLTVMLRGSHNSLSSSEIASLVLKSLSKHLDIQVTPDVLHIERIQHAIPQYTLGHFEKINFIENSIQKLSPRIHCLGSAFTGVSINDCISSALAKAHSIK